MTLRLTLPKSHRMLGVAAGLLLMQACTPSVAPSPPATPSSLSETRSMAERVAAETVVELPLVIHQGYPFVPGEVNGRHGHFMVDNGTPFSFFLNSHYVPVTVGRELGRGSAGSGQPIVVHEAQGVSSLHLGAQAARELKPGAADPQPDIMTADFAFIEAGVRSDFLGFIGSPWMSSFAYSLRYAPARWLITESGAGAERLLEGSERIALIRLEGQDGPLPFATLNIDGEKMITRFDTGTPGELQLTAAYKARLERAGRLRCRDRREPEPTVLCELQGLRYGTTDLELEPLAMSIGADNRITLGAALLSRYVTVWNLSRSTLDLRRDTSR